jgi:hypothetical protein
LQCFNELITYFRSRAKKAEAGSTGDRNSSILMAYSRRIKCRELDDQGYLPRRRLSFGIDGKMVNH